MNDTNNVFNQNRITSSTNNAGQENYLLVETDSVHGNINIFRRATLSKKTISISVIAAVILVAFCSAIYGISNLDGYSRDVMTGSRSGMTPKEKLLTYLRQVTNENLTISGMYVRDPNDNGYTGLQKIFRAAGVFPGIVSLSMPIYSASAAKWNLFIDEVIAYWNNSSLVDIHWLDNENPFTVLNSFTSSLYSYNVDGKWEQLIKHKSHINNEWKDQLDLVVPYLQRLQTAGVIAILDILPTMNHKQFIWRGRPGENGTAELYRITHDYLTKYHNLTSLIWVWSLNGNDMSMFEEFYPGNGYVDVVTVYMGEKKQLSTNKYQRLLNLVGNQPMSMQNMFTVPTPGLFSVQHRWTCFLASEPSLNMKAYNDNEKINTTFNSKSVINRGDIRFFTDTEF